MSELTQAITRLCRDHVNEEDSRIAELLIDDLTKDQLVHCLVGEVGTIRRGIERAKEQSAFAQLKKGKGSLDCFNKFKESIKDVHFSPSPGVRTPWVYATADDHRVRIAYLKKMRSGITITISYHEKAVDIIESSRVTCLAEVNTDAAEKLEAKLSEAAA